MVSSELILVVCGLSQLVCLSSHKCSRESVCTRTLLPASLSQFAHRFCWLRDKALDAYATGLSFCMRTAPKPLELASTEILTGLVTSK